jgi:medium-chain acyl-CoA synthetase
MSDAFNWDPPARYNFARDAIGRLAAERPDDRAMLWTDATGDMIDRSFAELADHGARAAAVLAGAGLNVAIPC